jgi:hypothetical protein
MRPKLSAATGEPVKVDVVGPDRPHFRPHISATPQHQTDRRKHPFLRSTANFRPVQHHTTIRKFLLIPRCRDKDPGRPRATVIFRDILDETHSGHPLHVFDTCLTEFQDLLDTLVATDLCPWWTGRWPPSPGPNSGEWADRPPRSAGDVPAEGFRDIPTRNLQWNKNPR